MTKEDMAKKLLWSLGAVDEDMVAEAAPGKRPEKGHLRIRYLVVAAAAVAVFVGVGIVLYTGLNGIIIDEVNGVTEIANVIEGNEQETVIESDRTAYEVWYGDVVYSDCAVSVDEARIGDNIGEATVEAWNNSTDTTQESTEIQGDVASSSTVTPMESTTRACEITGIQPKCAIAVWIEDENGERYEAFYNSAYLPATLGEFVEDLNLREDLSFGTVYSYADSEQTVKYSGVDDELIWKLLLSNTEAEASQCDDISSGRVMSIRIDMPILGCTNLAITVTEDGYLKTNLLATGKAFYIGEEAVEQFVEHVMNNYERVAETEALESYTILKEADPEEIETAVEGGVLPPFIPDDTDSEEIVTIEETETDSD